MRAIIQNIAFDFTDGEMLRNGDIVACEGSFYRISERTVHYGIDEDGVYNIEYISFSSTLL